MYVDNMVVTENNTVIQHGDNITINGKKLPPVPGNRASHNSTVVDGKVYIDGYEWKDDKWKKTLTAIWHLWF